MKNIANYLDSFINNEDYSFDECKNKKVKKVNINLRKSDKKNDDDLNDKSMYENKKPFKKRK